ncbi:HAMP domain-containing sensor histidine kinase [Okeania sp.]|uniref:sensor histidine kinase n=1 Tax=Okeania sp. TaxID=3100323 RepID=UPI002B4B79B2|nr:HAMP domain-containing sensor histidine kinase [Okeania sp.]MEB3342908.1 HAMP domain-containing sensor histidine kinase [Okeania sp.]
MTKKSITKSANFVKNKLMNLVTQEMLSPLTSVTGMASVLNQEIYGPLTEKQREYVEIINERSRYLRSLVQQIISLAKLEEVEQTSEVNPVDVKNLCQQIVKNLEVERDYHQVECFVLAGGSEHKIGLFDKEILEQTLYNLIYSIIQSSDSGSEVKLHLSEKSEELNVAVWVSHPLLGDSFPHSQLYSQKLSAIKKKSNSSLELNKSQITYIELKKIIFEKISTLGENSTANHTRALLALLFSCQLAEQQGGTLWIQDSAESGYRYILVLPFSK